jgi:hypothetical protein
MKSETTVLLTALIIVVCGGVGTAQECQIGCQSKIDALKNEVAALDRALAQQVPYLESDPESLFLVSLRSVSRFFSTTSFWKNAFPDGPLARL